MHHKRALKFRSLKRDGSAIVQSELHGNIVSITTTMRTIYWTRWMQEHCCGSVKARALLFVVLFPRLPFSH